MNNGEVGHTRWWLQPRQRLLDSAERVRRDVAAGRDLDPDVLGDAIYLFVRENDEPSLTQVYLDMEERYGQGDPRALVFDAALGTAWRTLHALRVPLSADQVDQRRICFACTAANRPAAVQAEDDDVLWRTLWRRVDAVLEYTGRLCERLAPLDDDDDSVQDDECVMLAVLSGLAVRAVKKQLSATHAEVPWEEMETVLAAFVEASTTLDDAVAAAVATPGRVQRHLACFRDSVSAVVAEYRGQTSAVMKDLARCPDCSRADAKAALRSAAESTDPAVDLHQVAAVLADYWSLLDIREALQVAVDALRLGDYDRESWGFMAAHRAAFVVLSRMTDSWTAPHLSASYIHLIELLAPPGTVQRLEDIRGDMRATAYVDRAALAADLTRTLEAVAKLCRLAELEVTALRAREVAAQPSHRDAKKARLSNGEQRASCVRDILAQLVVAGAAAAAAGELEPDDLEGKVVTEYLAETLGRDPACGTRRSGGKLLTRSNSFSPRYVYECAMDAIQRLPLDDSALSRYAAEGSVEAVAAYWQSQDPRPAAAIADLFVPNLYGRRLLDYLQAADRLLDRCFAPRAEVQVLVVFLRVGTEFMDVERGTQPPPRSWPEADAENERLLELARRKDAMFRCARRGDLAGVRRALEGGVDAASRDCQGRSLLQAAAAAGQDAVVRGLLALEGLDLRPAAGAAADSEAPGHRLVSKSQTKHFEEHILKFHS